mgnify:CR=1 FL=1
MRRPRPHAHEITAQSDIARRFIGTSRLVSIDDPARGPHPIGILMYDITGHMAVQVIPDTPRAKFSGFRDVAKENNLSPQEPLPFPPRLPPSGHGLVDRLRTDPEAGCEGPAGVAEHVHPEVGDPGAGTREGGPPAGGETRGNESAVRSDRPPPSGRELRENRRCILPQPGHRTQERAVADPRVPVEHPEVGDHLGAERVQVHIADEFQTLLTNLSCTLSPLATSIVLRLGGLLPLVFGSFAVQPR